MFPHRPAPPAWRGAGVLTLTVCLALGSTSCDRNGLFDGNTIQSVPEGPVKPPPGPDCPPPSPTDFPVRINEAVFKNIASLDDGTGKFPPSWVELYNTSDKVQNVGGVALTDSFGEPEKWIIPCIDESDIPPKGFLIIFLDGDTANPNDLHASFTLNPEALEVELVLNRGSDFFRFDAFELEADVAVGRPPDGVGSPKPLEAPTPGLPNLPPAGPKELLFVRGDANQTGTVNVSDLAIIQKVVAGTTALPRCADALDANDDGMVDGADAAYLQQFLFGLGPPPPPPFPDRGRDSTADALHCLE